MHHHQKLSWLFCQYLHSALINLLVLSRHCQTKHEIRIIFLWNKEVFEMVFICGLCLWFFKNFIMYFDDVYGLKWLYISTVGSRRTLYTVKNIVWAVSIANLKKSIHHWWKILWHKAGRTVLRILAWYIKNNDYLWAACNGLKEARLVVTAYYTSLSLFYCVLQMMSYAYKTSVRFGQIMHNHAF